MVVDEILIAAPLARVLHRLQGYLGSDGPAAAARDAVTGEDAALMRAGVSFASKQVIVRTLPPVTKDERIEIAMSWSATGPTQNLYPSLEAIISLEAIDQATTRVGIVGSYLPPLGDVGRVIDRVVGQRVAAATVASFLARAKRHVLHQTEEGRDARAAMEPGHPNRLNIGDEPLY